MDTFHKYPSTPHIFWLGAATPRDDKVLAPDEADTFLDGHIIVEEKVDGANVGISFSKAGDLRIQNRGQYLAGEPHGQFNGISHWAQRIEDALFDVLGDSRILFGEWCYAQHSVYYTTLPGWFLGFDVFDETAQAFWSVEKRGCLLARIRFPIVAEIARGYMSTDRLMSLLNRPAAYGAPHVEGLYLRRESAGLLEQRAKIVRAEFTDGITEHWSCKPMTVNECRASYG